VGLTRSRRPASVLSLAQEDLQCFAVRDGSAVGPVRGQRIVDVCYLKDSGLQGNSVSSYNTYFRDARGIYVNLYIPSTLNWVQESAQVSLTQKGSYPFDSVIQFEVKASHPARFALRLRIPTWAANASVFVNGKRMIEAVTPRSFAATERKWKSGDQVELELPMTLRLEALNAHHENTVAVLNGPLLLFPLGKGPHSLTRNELLAAKSTAPGRWQTEATAR
jgi:DUF1680 family protein